jgi:uncharacterized membrane protein YphA (DoxX/SURF4 family)
MAVSEEQRRQIAVHAREVGEFEIDVAPIELDPAAGVGATVGAAVAVAVVAVAATLALVVGVATAAAAVDAVMCFPEYEAAAT